MAGAIGGLIVFLGGAAVGAFLALLAVGGEPSDPEMREAAERDVPR